MIDPKRISLIAALLWAAAPGALALSSAPVSAFTFVDDHEDEGEHESDEDEGPKWSAVTGGDVHTGTGATLRGATVLSKDGVIVEIGYDLYIPEDAEVLDATGYSVYPGLVAVRSSGLFGSSGSIDDSVDPFNRNMVLALASGLTTAVNGSEAAKLKYGEIEDLVINDNFFASLSYSNGNPSGKKQLREKFKSAAAYLREYRVWQVKVKSDKELKEPKTSGLDANVIAVLSGAKRAVFNADDRHDLLEIARLAQTFDFRPVITGAAEGWTVADELGRAGAMAILTARERGPKDERLEREGGASIENAAKLYKAGVQIAIIPAVSGINSLGGIVGRDIIHLPTEAAFAVRGGLPEAAAIEAITVVPARLIGADHRIGTLEEGKDADLIITDGDILHYETFVQWAIVDGKVVYDKQSDLFYAHIRPRPETEIAPEAKTDVGEGEDEVIEAPEEEESEEEEGEEGAPEEEAGDGGDGDQ